ncbi:MAG: cytochrome C [Gammaproteobacteria bacterium]|nr:cytochrome C [Gammaproteobacteria bacterium]
MSIQNLAQSASIEALVMPGPVIEAHSSFETECKKCHTAFSRSMQSDLCLSCHEHRNVGEDREAGTGLHGRFEPAKMNDCASCHTDHKGREADVLPLDLETFNHGPTDFELKGTHTTIGCEGCHEDSVRYLEAPNNCFDCHKEDDSHLGHLGENCDTCHNETNWLTTTFDHNADTDFILTGAHQSVECAFCHTNQRYKGIPTDCNSCHQIDDQHDGGYGKACDKCHQTQVWEKTTFNHAKKNGFVLQGRHSEIMCDSCHKTDNFDEQVGRKCVDCHMADDVHEGANNTKCGSCHDTKQWANVTFDHKTDTNFPLKGEHKNLDCKVCHSSDSPDKSTGTTCFSCHQVGDIHEQALGKNCDRCHQQNGWLTDIIFDHDLTTFPLIGLHSVVLCEACHQTEQYAGTPGKCLSCHDQDDAHDGEFSINCGDCHNPNDWLLWRFDHTENSGFALEGAHSNLACRDCHTEGHGYGFGTSVKCFTCHRNDDIHSGEFGRLCERCHDNISFGAAGTVQ